MSTQNIPKVSEIFSFEVIRSQKSYEVLKMFVDIRACNLFISICEETRRRCFAGLPPHKMALGTSEAFLAS